MITERQYIGINDNATVITDDNGDVITMTGKEWKAYKANGGEVAHVGALPAYVKRVLLDHTTTTPQD